MVYGWFASFSTIAVPLTISACSLPSLIASSQLMLGSSLSAAVVVAMRCAMNSLIVGVAAGVRAGARVAVLISALFAIGVGDGVRAGTFAIARPPMRIATMKKTAKYLLFIFPSHRLQDF
jgi:hypothetical protein